MVMFNIDRTKFLQELESSTDKWFYRCVRYQAKWVDYSQTGIRVDIKRTAQVPSRKQDSLTADPLSDPWCAYQAQPCTMKHFIDGRGPCLR